MQCYGMVFYAMLWYPQYTWDGANNFCQLQPNATLLELTTQEQLEFVQVHFSKHVEPSVLTDGALLPGAARGRPGLVDLGHRRRQGRALALGHLPTGGAPRLDHFVLWLIISWRFVVFWHVILCKLSSAQLIDSFLWAPNYPSGASDNCLFLNSNLGYQGENYNCLVSDRFYPICQKK